MVENEMAGDAANPRRVTIQPFSCTLLHLLEVVEMVVVEMVMMMMVEMVMQQTRVE